MGYRNLQECVADLEKVGQLRRIDVPVDPYLELAHIQRRAFRSKSPALLFTRVKGCSFPMLANLFGTTERLHYIFRDSLAGVEAVLAAKADPAAALKHPLRSCGPCPRCRTCCPGRTSKAPVLENRCALSALPRLVGWPMDGGPFITLPLVYSEDPARPGPDASNLGMYRVQLAGNDYAADEVGLHYQIHRGIGVHHAEALKRGQSLPVNIFVGGPPAFTVAAVMPLPEGPVGTALRGACWGAAVRPCITAAVCPCRCWPRRISASAATSCRTSSPKAPLATMWATTA